MGLLSSDQIEALRRDLTPADDMIQLVDINTAHIQLNTGEVLIPIKNATLMTKKEFDGFSEIEHWNAEFDVAIEQAKVAKENALATNLKGQQRPAFSKRASSA